MRTPRRGAAVQAPTLKTIYLWSDRDTSSDRTRQFANCGQIFGDDHVRSIIEEPFHRTQVGAVPVLINLRSRLAAHLSSAEPCQSVPEPPHMVDLALRGYTSVNAQNVGDFREFFKRKKLHKIF